MAHHTFVLEHDDLGQNLSYDYDIRHTFSISIMHLIVK